MTLDLSDRWNTESALKSEEKPNVVFFLWVCVLGFSPQHLVPSTLCIQHHHLHQHTAGDQSFTLDTGSLHTITVIARPHRGRGAEPRGPQDPALWFLRPPGRSDSLSINTSYLRWNTSVFRKPQNRFSGETQAIKPPWRQTRVHSSVVVLCDEVRTEMDLKLVYMSKGF